MASRNSAKFSWSRKSLGRRTSASRYRAYAFVWCSGVSFACSPASSRIRKSRLVRDVSWSCREGLRFAGAHCRRRRVGSNRSAPAGARRVGVRPICRCVALRGFGEERQDRLGQGPAQVIVACEVGVNVLEKRFPARDPGRGCLRNAWAQSTLTTRSARCRAATRSMAALIAASARNGRASHAQACWNAARPQGNGPGGPGIRPSGTGAPRTVGRWLQRACRPRCAAAQLPAASWSGRPGTSGRSLREHRLQLRVGREANGPQSLRLTATVLSTTGTPARMPRRTMASRFFSKCAQTRGRLGSLGGTRFSRNILRPPRRCWWRTTAPARRQRRHRLPHARGLQREAGTHERQAGRARTEDRRRPNGPTFRCCPHRQSTVALIVDRLLSHEAQGVELTAVIAIGRPRTCDRSWSRTSR